MTISRMCVLVRASLLEIVGEEDSKPLLAHLSVDVLWSLAELRVKLADRYGNVSASGLMWQIGRSFFREYLVNLKDGDGLLLPDLRFLPFRRKAQAGLAILAREFSGVDQQQVTASSRGGLYLWRIENCLDCNHPRIKDNDCSFYLGFLQEYLAWIGGGRAYIVEEKECISRGANACLISINLDPVE